MGLERATGVRTGPVGSGGYVHSRLIWMAIRGALEGPNFYGCPLVPPDTQT